MSKYKVTDDQFIQIVKESYSLAEVIRKSGLQVAGGNYETTKNRIKKLNLDTSHFTGQSWNKGKKLGSNYYGNLKPLKEVLVENSNYQSYKLLKRLFSEGLKEHKCECCGLTKWQSSEIPLELHHINGIHSDNRLENLQVLCPNCHALTDNYRGKNKGKSAQKEISNVEAS